MSKKSVITLPNGTTIEISPDLTPEQITAMITAVTATGSVPVKNSAPEESTGKTFEHVRSPEEIWESSKRERLALFLRNYLANTLWFSSKDVQDQQLSVTGKLALGETSAIGTYLNRLFESGHLDRKKGTGRIVFYRITDKLLDEYPEISVDHMKQLVNQ